MYSPIDRALLFAALVAAAGWALPDLDFAELANALRVWPPAARA